MSADFSKHPAYVDPQGWSAAAQIMQAAGHDQCSDARYRLDASIRRTRALVRALHLMVYETAAPNMQDVSMMIDLVRDTVEDMGEDPLAFVEDFDISVNSAIYQSLKARPAEASPPVMSEEEFGEKLKEALSAVLEVTPVVAPAAPSAKPKRRRKGSKAVPAGIELEGA